MVLNAMEKFDKLSVGDVQTLSRVSDRMNLVEFVNFDHHKQNRILKSCIKKTVMKISRALLFTS